MRRQRTTCWFAQTVLRPLGFETVDHRSTVRKSAKKSRRTAGKILVQLFFMPDSCLLKLSCCVVTQYLHISVVGHLWCASLCFLTGLSTFKGTAGNATCFPLTVSAMVCRSRAMLTLRCMRKKVTVPHFQMTSVPLSFR